MNFPVIFFKAFQGSQGHGSIIRPGSCRLVMTAIACEVRAKEASSLLKFIGDTKGVADGKAKNNVIELFVVRGDLHILVLYLNIGSTTAVFSHFLPVTACIHRSQAGIVRPE
jgi:hypothetical protein